MPLILKLNGKTDIPSDAEALSPVHAVGRGRRAARRRRGRLHAVRRHAGAGARLRAVPARSARDAQRLGMPLIVWAYPRGAAIEAKGGKDSFYAVDYAARTASELGADVVKVNFPHPDEARRRASRRTTPSSRSQQAIDAVVRSANRTLVLVSGGARAGDEAMIEKAPQSMEAGATGLIFGRNVWQREHDESLRFVARLREILAKYPTP